MATNSTALAEKFYADFQTQVRTIEDAIDRQRDAFSTGEKHSKDVSLDKHLTEIADLQREVRDATVYTSSHDQRVYATAIKSLQNRVEALKTLVKPRGKFSFKSARRPPATPAAPKPQGQLATTVGSVQPVAVNSMEATEDAKGFKGENLIGASDRTTRMRKIVATTAALQEAAAPSVRRASLCVIDISSQQHEAFPGLHVVNVTESFVWCGSTSGGLHITDVHSSVLVVTTHQFRMHRCSNVTVYLAAGSSPIIEDCTDIRFAPLALQTQAESGFPRNAWNDVLDFQYPGLTGPSPNWCELPESQRLLAAGSRADLQWALDGQLRQITHVGALRACLIGMGVKKTWSDDQVAEDGTELAGLELLWGCQVEDRGAVMGQGGSETTKQDEIFSS